VIVPEFVKSIAFEKYIFQNQVFSKYNQVKFCTFAYVTPVKLFTIQFHDIAGAI
jgi:hypothetical protein